MDSDKSAAARALRFGVYLSAFFFAGGLFFRTDLPLRLGTAVLILTPLARVLVFGAQSARRGRWSWAGLCLLVLFLIAASAALKTTL